MNVPEADRHATLLIVGTDPEKAAAITSSLRTQRLAIAVEFLPSLEDLEAREVTAQDIVVWDAGAPWSLSEVETRLAARNLNPPLLALLPSLEPARLDALAREGARDVIALDTPGHLAAVVRRELAVAEARAERRHLAETCQELQTSWLATLKALPIPAVLLQDGMPVLVNEAYQRFFHNEHAADIPFLGLFPKTEQENLKRALRSASRASDQEVLELTVPHPDDRARMVHLSLVPEMYERQVAVLALLNTEASPLPSRAESASSPPQSPAPASERETHSLESPPRFVARLEEYLRSSPPKKTVQALLMVGIDEYARLVDDHGPLVGESILKQVEQKLLPELLPLEFATRLGRDYYLWLQRPHSEGVEVFAQSLLTHLNEHVYEAGSYSLQITCRIGWADRRQCRDVWELVRAAHQAYTHGAGQPVSRYVPSIAGIENPERIAGSFRRQLEGDLLGLGIETMNPLRTDARTPPILLTSIVGEPLSGLERQDLFKVVKRAGLLRAHDRWLISHALQRYQEITTRHGPQSLLALRVSGETLEDGEFPSWFARQREHYADVGELLLLVSERTAAARLRTVQSLVPIAARHGLKIGICEFGTIPQSHVMLRTIRPAFVILHPQLAQELVALAAIPRAKRHQHPPLGTLLEAAQETNVSLAIGVAGDAIEQMKAAHSLGFSYLLTGSSEILKPAG